MATEISPTDLTVLHTSVERLSGTISATIAHFQREGAKELAELHQLAIEDVIRLRDFLTRKGIVTKPLAFATVDVSKIGLDALTEAVKHATGTIQPLAVNRDPDAPEVSL